MFSADFISGSRDFTQDLTSGVLILILSYGVYNTGRGKTYAHASISAFPVLHMLCALRCFSLLLLISSHR